MLWEMNHITYHKLHLVGGIFQGDCLYVLAEYVLFSSHIFCYDLILMHISWTHLNFVYASQLSEIFDEKILEKAQCTGLA